MADQVRTKADLLTRFPDNTSQIITPQDVRDFLVSVLGGYGQIYTANSSIALAIVTTVWSKLAAFDTDSVSDDITVSSANDNLTILTTAIFEISFNVSFTGSTVTARWDIQIAKNSGASFLSASAGVTTDSDGSVSASGSGLVTLTAGDILDLRVKHDQGGTENITVKHSSLTVKRVA